MSDSTRPGRAKGSVATVALVIAALLTMFVAAPVASAAPPSPIASGTTRLTVKGALARKMQTAKIRLGVVKPSRFRGNGVIFRVTGGELALRTGAGQIALGGGLKIKSGKRTVTLRSFTIDTRSRSLSVEVGGRTLRLAALGATSVARLGFGDSIGARKVRLTAAGASALNNVLAPAPKAERVFRANMVLGSILTEVEPKTVNVTPSGSLTYTGDPTLLGKLTNVKVEIQPIAPDHRRRPTFTSELGGGTISPLGTGGTIDSGGGLRLVQVLPTSSTPISTTITLGSFAVDLAERTATVEVTGESNAKEASGGMPLNFGALPCNPIAEVTVEGVTPSPATRTVGVNATATLQPIPAEVLEGFVKTYQGWYAGVASQALEEEIKAGRKPAMTEAEVKAAGAKAAEEKVAADQIRSGEALGSFSFLATGE